MSTQPKKWWEVAQTEPEIKFFRMLARETMAKRFDFRTMDAIIRETGLKPAVVENIIQKYLPTGIVEQHSKEPNKFRYWEAAKKRKKNKGSVAGADKEKRIKAVAKGP